MFSNQQKRGLLYLLLILVSIFLCIDLIRSRRNEQETMGETPQTTQQSQAVDSIVMFEFDPNTVTLVELRSLGLSKSAAVSIIRWRSAGKVFHIKEDLYESYNLTDSAYYILEPYIKIGEEFQYQKRESYDNAPIYQTTQKRQTKRMYTPLSQFLIDTVGVDYLYRTGLLSMRQAEVFVKWHRMSSMSNMDDVRECYVVSDSVASRMEPYIIFATKEDDADKVTYPVDINKADSATLRTVYGIGEKSVMEIIKYRQKLGGFYSVNQLSELKMVTESNFEKIIQQISCDSCDISKIDVNFALAKKLMGHPYITTKALRRLLKTRQIKGGWSNIVEMTEDNIFTKEEAARLRPYLLFEEYTKLQ